nr:uncharacterized protein LOC113824447 [Penaeus vannamei]
MNICMRWLWRLWLRSSLTKSLPFLVVTVFCAHQILSNDPWLHSRSRSDEVVQEVETRKGESQSTVAAAVAASARASDGLPPSEVPLPSSGDWIEVAGSPREVFAYSAYLDRRGHFNVVRVVAIIMKRKKVNECQVWSKNSTQRLAAKTRIIHENWNLAYSAAFILCEIPASLEPTRVVPVVNGRGERSSSLSSGCSPKDPRWEPERMRQPFTTSSIELCGWWSSSSSTGCWERISSYYTTTRWAPTSRRSSPSTSLSVESQSSLGRCVGARMRPRKRAD